jgi:WD40 repeat protein
MKLSNRLISFFLLVVCLIGCANQSEAISTRVLPTETMLPRLTPTLRFVPTEIISFTNTSSPNPALEEKLFQLPPLSLPEFNAQYSAGDMALSLDKELMAVVSENKMYGTESVWIWNVQDLSQSSFGYQVNVEKLWSVAFSPEGDLVAMGGTEKILIFVWQTGDIVESIPTPNLEPVQLVFRPNNFILWSAFNDTVTVWDVSRREAKYSVEGVTGFEPNSFAVSPDGKVLVTGAYTGINLWDVETGQNLGFREEPEGGIGIAPAITFSETGKFLASTGCSEFVFEGCARGNVIIWRSDSIDPSIISDVHFGWAKTLAFSPDEGILASSSGDGKIELINLGDGKINAALSLDIPAQLPPNNHLLVKDIVFLLRGDIIAVSTTNGIQLLDVAKMSWLPNLRFILSLGYFYSIAAAGDNLNFRTRPSLNDDVIRRLHTGEGFVVINGPKIVDNQVWWNVKIEDNTEGWIVEMPGWYEFAQ